MALTRALTGPPGDGPELLRVDETIRVEVEALPLPALPVWVGVGSVGFADRGLASRARQHPGSGGSGGVGAGGCSF